MVVARFHVGTLSPGVVRLPDAEARHARAARRLSVGDPVVLVDGRGHEAVGRIVASTRAGVDVSIDQIVSKARPSPQLMLAAALPKGPRQDTLIEKCTELGVAGIQPLVTERSIASASEHRRDKWQRTMIEAAKQSGQCWLPDLHEPRELGEVLGDLSRFDRVIVASLGDTVGASPATQEAATARRPVGATIVDLVDELVSADRLIAFVGPEGGWTRGEIERLVAAGARPVSLGPNTLRIETAAIAVAAAIHAVARRE